MNFKLHVELPPKWAFTGVRRVKRIDQPERWEAHLTSADCHYIVAEGVSPQHALGVAVQMAKDEACNQVVDRL